MCRSLYMLKAWDLLEPELQAASEPLNMNAGNWIWVLWKNSKNLSCWAISPALQTCLLDILTMFIVCIHCAQTLMDLTSLSEVHRLQRPRIPVLDPLVAQAGVFSFPSKPIHIHLPPHSPSPPCCLLFVPRNSETTKKWLPPSFSSRPNQSNKGAELNWPKLSKEKRNGGHRRHFKEIELVFTFREVSA